jgi:hypothetical protein
MFSWRRDRSFQFDEAWSLEQGAALRAGDRSWEIADREKTVARGLVRLRGVRAAERREWKRVRIMTADSFFGFSWGAKQNPIPRANRNPQGGD